MSVEIDGVNGIIKNTTSDGDVTIKGNDGGSEISALVFDMSAAGAATFNNKIIATELDISGAIDVDGTTNLDVVDIDGAVDMASTLGVSGVLTGTTAVFSSTSADDNFVITSTDADAGDPAPDLVLYRNSSSPVDGDDIGRIEFRARNNNSQDIVPVTFSTFTTAVADGSESGYLAIATLVAGSQKNRLGIDQTETVFNDNSADLDFRVESNGDANMLFVNGGTDRVGIKTNAPTKTLGIGGDGVISLEGGSNAISFYDSSTLRAYITSQSFGDHNGDGLGIVTATGEPIKFHTNGGERMRITSTGQVLQGATSSNAVQRSKGVANNDLQFHFSNSSTTTPYGGIIDFDAVGASGADNNTQYFLRCGDTTAIRFFVYSDGDVQNHDNSYGAISDERIKSNITDANSQWNDIKNIKVRNFQKKDDIRDYGADKAKVQLGVIAQELETVSPKLVKEYNPTNNDILSDSAFGTLYTSDDAETQDAVLYTSDDQEVIDGNKNVGDIKTEASKKIGEVKEITAKVKGVNYSILYMKAIKALQEAMTRIETLETKVAALEG